MGANIDIKQEPSRVAVIGLVFMSPALLFLLAALLKYGMGVGLLFDSVERLVSDPSRLRVFNIVSPALFLGGTTVALVLNVLAVSHVELHWQEKSLVSTISIQGKALNFALIGAATLVLVVSVLYAFLENYSILSR